MSDLVIVTDDGPVRTVRMNRPDKKNALTGAMYQAIAAAIEESGESAAIRCVLIAGSPGAFCAGNDINEFVKAAAGGESLDRSSMRLLHALPRSKKPLVAAVQGVAVGIGTTMLLHCDHVVAATNAKFSTPFISLGILPEAASSLIAPRLMGYARAFSLLVMGRQLDASEAKAAGIVNTVAAPTEVEAEAMKAALQIAALPAEGVAIARRLMRGEPDEIIARIDEEAELFKKRLASPEAHAAFAAFLNRKR
jgi:enoyl-CoA hydratase/carnithine racemase